jgi:hypothetical protein
MKIGISGNWEMLIETGNEAASALYVQHLQPMRAWSEVLVLPADETPDTRFNMSTGGEA